MWAHFKKLLAGLRGSSSEGQNPERALWLRLRKLRDLGFAFKRQGQISSYVLDFVEHKARLAIILDSGPAPENDNVRDKVLLDEGYRLLRFSPDDIHTDIDGVTDFIVMQLLLRPRRKRREPVASDTA